METGKVEYAPDYESEKSYPDMTPVFDAMAVRAERQRLEREVVQTAMRVHHAELAVNTYWDQQPEGEASRAEILGPLVGEVNDAQQTCSAACDALLDFEREHGPRK